MNKTCIRCGEPLKKGAGKYCGKRCYGDSLIKRVQRICEVCGGTFLARHDAVEQGNGRFCTRACVNRSRKVSLDARLDEILGRCTRNENGCLLWAGTLDRAGYGIIAGDAEDNWKQLRASHLVYEKFVAPIPDGQYVLHRCDNPPCVEPDHLWLGSKKENMLDMVQKGRGGIHSPYKLTEDDVRAIRQHYTTEHISQEKLGAAFGINQRTVSRIVRGKNWKSVT